MLFRTAATIALLASGAVAGRAPYMPVAGLSLARRSTNGYQPEQSVCKDGNSCSEACGSQYQDCASNDSDDHCYNPSIGQTCCADGTGNSCDKGYYCTHDTKANTMCCPDSMSLSECAEAYKVTGTLATNVLLTTSTTSTSSTPSSTSTSTTSTTAFTSTTPSSTSVKSTYSTPEVESTTPAYTTESVKTEVLNTTTPCATSAVYTTPVIVGSNSTYSAPSHTAGSTAGSGSGSSSGSTTASAPASTGAAAATSMSALLLAAAGLFALF